jgi:hypothetical protein
MEVLSVQDWHGMRQKSVQVQWGQDGYESHECLVFMHRKLGA